MPEKLTVPPRRPFTTFLDFPLHTDLDTFDAHVAILGLPYGDPYNIDEVTNDQTNAPTAVRRASSRLSMHHDRFDFDIGGTLLDGHDVRVGGLRRRPGRRSRPRRALPKGGGGGAEDPGRWRHAHQHRRRPRSADPGIPRL